MNKKFQIEELIKEKNVTVVSEHLNDIYEGQIEGSKSVFDLIKSGDYKQAVQLIDVIANGVAKMKITSDEDKKVVNEVKKKMLNDLEKVSISF